jgi:formylglycine-generating enzyme required for sulfatase activity
MIEVSQWFIIQAGKQKGPYTDMQMSQMVAQRQLAPSDLAWKNGMGEWAPAATVVPDFLSEQVKTSFPTSPPPFPVLGGTTRTGKHAGRGANENLVRPQTVTATGIGRKSAVSKGTSEKLQSQEDWDDLPVALPAEKKAREEQREEDKLEGYWKGIIWGSLLIPCIGPTIIVILSSVLYFTWRNEYPNKARSINRHGWMAFFVWLAIGVLLLVLSSIFGDGQQKQVSPGGSTREGATNSTSKLEKVLTNSLGMRFALIPVGSFLMGSPESEVGRGQDEGPQHKVEITWPFYLGIYPVTQGQWQRVMGNSPSWFSSIGDGKDKVQGLDTTDFPVEQVDWDDCQEFCHKLSELPEEKRFGRVYRLPTEAEWEYSGRGEANTYQVFAFGDTLTLGQANFNDVLSRTCEVGSYPPNGFGLYDMHGNVCQWCADWYDANYYRESPLRDPRGPPLGSYRVVRGGDHHFGPLHCRLACRGRLGPGGRYDNVGCRLALVSPSGPGR